MSEKNFNEAGKELFLFSMNERDLYQFRLAIYRNLAQKQGSGIYDHEKAVSAFASFCIAAAKKYHRIFCTSTDKYFDVFPASARKICAEMYVSDFENSGSADFEYLLFDKEIKSASELFKVSYFKKNNPHYIDKETLEFFGEKKSEIKLFSRRKYFKNWKGEKVFCFVLYHYQRNNPNICKRVLH